MKKLLWLLLLILPIARGIASLDGVVTWDGDIPTTVYPFWREFFNALIGEVVILSMFYLLSKSQYYDQSNAVR